MRVFLNYIVKLQDSQEIIFKRDSETENSNENKYCGNYQNEMRQFNVIDTNSYYETLQNNNKQINTTSISNVNEALRKQTNANKYCGNLQIKKKILTKHDLDPGENCNLDGIHRILQLL